MASILAIANWIACLGPLQKGHVPGMLQAASRLHPCAMARYYSSIAFAFPKVHLIVGHED
jgi:hypothetical protein